MEKENQEIEKKRDAVPDRKRMVENNAYVFHNDISELHRLVTFLHVLWH